MADLWSACEGQKLLRVKPVGDSFWHFLLIMTTLCCQMINAAVKCCPWLTACAVATKAWCWCAIIVTSTHFLLNLFFSLAKGELLLQCLCLSLPEVTSFKNCSFAKETTPKLVFKFLLGYRVDGIMKNGIILLDLTMGILNHQYFIWIGVVWNRNEA